MTLAVCPECNGTLSSRATQCPHCGWRRPAGQRAVSPAVIVAVIVAAVLLFVGLALWSSQSDADRNAEQRRQIDKSARDFHDAATPGR